MTKSNQNQILNFLYKSANWSKKSYKLSKQGINISLEVGEVLITYPILSDKCGITERQARTFIQNNTGIEFTRRVIKNKFNRPIGTVLKLMSDQKTAIEKGFLEIKSDKSNKRLIDKLQEIIANQNQAIKSQSCFIEKILFEKSELKSEYQKQVDSRVQAYIDSIKTTNNPSKKCFKIDEEDKSQYDLLLSKLESFEYSIFEKNGLWIKYKNDFNKLIDTIEYTLYRERVGKVDCKESFLKMALKANYNISELYSVQEKEKEDQIANEQALRDQEEKELRLEESRKQAIIKQEELKLVLDWMENNQESKLYSQAIESFVSNKPVYTSIQKKLNSGISEYEIFSKSEFLLKSSDLYSKIIQIIQYQKSSKLIKNESLKPLHIVFLTCFVSQELSENSKKPNYKGKTTQKRYSYKLAYTKSYKNKEKNSKVDYQEFKGFENSLRNSSIGILPSAFSYLLANEISRGGSIDIEKDLHISRNSLIRSATSFDGSKSIPLNFIHNRDWNIATLRIADSISDIVDSSGNESISDCDVLAPSPSCSNGCPVGCSFMYLSHTINLEDMQRSIRENNYNLELKIRRNYTKYNLNLSENYDSSEMNNLRCVAPSLLAPPHTLRWGFACKGLSRNFGRSVCAIP